MMFTSGMLGYLTDVTPYTNMSKKIKYGTLAIKDISLS